MQRGPLSEGELNSSPSTSAGSESAAHSLMQTRRGPRHDAAALSSLLLLQLSCYCLLGTVCYKLAPVSQHFRPSQHPLHLQAAQG